MKITYKWELTRLRKADIGDLSGVVVQTYWTCTGKSSDGYSGTFLGATPFDPSAVDPENYTAFESLTEQQVLGWIKSVVAGPYKEHVEGSIKRQIDAQRAVTTEVAADELPWTKVAG